jgi:hypothetical protein
LIPAAMSRVSLVTRMHIKATHNVAMAAGKYRFDWRALRYL